MNNIRKHLLKCMMAVILAISGKMFAQMGINTDSPKVTLQVVGKKSDGSTPEGLRAPMMTGNALNAAATTNKYGAAQDGAIVYVTQVPTTPAGQTSNISCRGYYYYDNSVNKWMKFGTSCPASITNLSCSTATHNGTITQGTSPSGASTVINYTGGNGGAYASQTINSTGVTGLTATLAAGTLANGNGSVTYTISGNANASGTASFAISLGGQSCTFTRQVAPSASMPAGSGSLGGRACFDVVEQYIGPDCGTLASRATQKADFSQTATNTQTYTFTPSGAVSNVRFVYVNTNGQVIQSLTGGNSSNNISGAVTATVVYYNNLNTTAKGLSRAQALLADIYVIYNDNASNTGTDRSLKLTVRVQDCPCCGAYLGPNQTLWKEFMCHNLGADYTADPFTPAAAIHGAKYQWGAQTGQTGQYLSQADDQANSGTISGWVFQAVKSYSLWANDDPCPDGYRLPTRTQSAALYNNNTFERVGSFTNSPTNFTSAVYVTTPTGARLLMLPAAGRRDRSGGALLFRGSIGSYWGIDYEQTGSATNNEGCPLSFGGTAGDGPGPAAPDNSSYGNSIRCIKE